jgi:hypothetical protein
MLFEHSVTSEDPTTTHPPIRDDQDARLIALCAEGWAIWDKFDAEVRERRFHPFVAADYDAVLAALRQHYRPGLRFLEWGSATGIITIMADLLGYEAYGIELDAALVETAQRLVREYESSARIVAGSFLPTGYEWQNPEGDRRTGTLGSGRSGYLELGRALDEFDIVFGYPWGGEEPMMLDLMRRYGRSDATLLLHSATTGITAHRGGAAAS